MQNKDRKWLHVQKLGVIAILTMVSLAGCGKTEEVDYSIEGIAEETQSEDAVGQSALSQFADEPNWVDSWTVEEEMDFGGSLKVSATVDAQVVLPDTEEMTVVEVTVQEFDAEFKEHVVQTLLGNGDVYYNDAEHLPKKELEAQYEDYKRRYEEALSESDRQILKLSMDKYEKLLETAGDTYTLVDSYDRNDYIGESDGITYELWFSENYGNDAGWDVNTQSFSFDAIDFEKICPEEYEDYTRYMEHSHMTCERYAEVGENACELSLEDAGKQARKLLEDLGLEYSALAYVKPLIWGDDTLSSSNIYDWPANGYVLTFEYGIDDLSLCSFGTNYDYTTGATGYTIGEQVPYSMNTFAKVYITDKGILNLHVNCPVETVEISSRVELLPLDTIKEIMKDGTVNAFRSYRGEVVETYTYLELIYFRVGDKEDMRHYSYVPAWRLSDQVGAAVLGNWEIRSPLVINAIDGSWIDAAAEMGPHYFESYD